MSLKFEILERLLCSALQIYHSFIMSHRERKTILILEMVRFNCGDKGLPAYYGQEPLKHLKLMEIT